jgi:hypothetical protein
MVFSLMIDAMTPIMDDITNDLTWILKALDAAAYDLSARSNTASNDSDSDLS